MGDAILSTEVKDALRRATANGNVIVLPEGQLERGLYVAVDKALKNAGGKWKRGIGHVFPGEAESKLLAMLGTGVSVDEKKRDQAFFTPPDLAERVVALADVRCQRVLEPSAGRGALANACRDARAASVDCCEVNPEYAEHLARNEYAVMLGDFLTLNPVDLYDRVVMNPPFTRNQDVAHVKHALKWLKPGGVLVSLMLNNQTRKAFADFINDLDFEIEELERGAFKESGTDVSTLILKIYN